VCHQAATVAHGLDPSDLPWYARHGDYATAVLPGAMHSAKMRRLMLASSMVVYGKGRYTCVERAWCGRRRGGPADLAAGRIEPVYRVAEVVWRPASCRRMPGSVHGFRHRDPDPAGPPARRHHPRSVPEPGMVHHLLPTPHQVIITQ
jgi:dTDP-L-rhamnose 4-epimerase